MMMNRKIVLIGGSAGSFRVVCTLLQHLQKPLPFPVVLILHRMKSVSSGFAEALQGPAGRVNVLEPDDKTLILPGRIYLAPANYHLLCENRSRFALSTDEPLQYSRPSIDATLESAADVFGTDAVAIILSGANKDGASGAAHIHREGGSVIVQSPDECEIPAMVLETIRQVPSALRKTCTEIISFINGL
jgi:two-component system chemotaxis response regulator CheB